MSDLRYALLGAGRWAQYQLAAWHEIPQVECVAIYNRTGSKAKELSGRFGIRNTYDNVDELLESESLDFVDVVTRSTSHRHLVEASVGRGIPTICQQPLAATVSDAEAMVALAERTKVPLLVHENWRWQSPLARVQGGSSETVPVACRRAVHAAGDPASHLGD